MMSGISQAAPGGPVNGGGIDDGLPRLRESIAESVVGRLGHEIPGLTAHFGEHYEKSDDPEASIYRSTGASFRWLAFAFAPWRMWDLHVGIVSTNGRLSVGYHISERASPALLGELKRLGDDIKAPVLHQKAAFEYQANLPLIDVDAVPLEAIVDTVANLCRKYAAVAASVPCPAAMRDGAR